jgi:hypothetical protein
MTGWTRLAVAVACVLLAATAAAAHDPKGKKLGPTKAKADLEAARTAMDAAKARLAADGRYSCCTKPSCDTCARVNGSCNCAANVEAGKGACGECVEGWKAGRGALDGVEPDQIPLLASDKQACHDGAAPPELAEARERINQAKRTLVSEERFTCCVRKGGCDTCAHEGNCPCGTDLAALAVARDKGEPGEKDAGVCGDCLDGWHRGHGAFPGIAAADVPLGSAHLGAVHGAMSSGTSALPATSPARGISWRPGDWLVMLQGDVRVGLNKQNGPRGVGKLESQNWLMAMADRPVGPGMLSLRGMVSAEPITTPHGGFPQLFQTGETYRGREIVDAQHPHDLFMELAAYYTLPLGERAVWELYAGVVGEPALGPPAFMHRPSAAENPAAPLGHHWQDSSHITHGVVTTGFDFGKVKVEGSVFRGAEPDENRGDIEMGALDSWSARVWLRPSPAWAIQVSHGRLNDPEPFEVGDTVRTTASIHHNVAWDRGNWASAVIWGRNSESHGDSNAYLFESTARFLDRNTVYTRMELVDKQHLLDENIFGRPGLELHDGEEHGEEQSFRVAGFTFGYVRDVYSDRWMTVGLGADFTVYAAPGALDAVYGRTPTAAHAFVRVRLGGN